MNFWVITEKGIYKPYALIDKGDSYLLIGGCEMICIGYAFGKPVFRTKRKISRLEIPKSEVVHIQFVYKNRKEVRKWLKKGLHPVGAN